MSKNKKNPAPDVRAAVFAEAERLAGVLLENGTADAPPRARLERLDALARLHDIQAKTRPRTRNWRRLAVVAGAFFATLAAVTAMLVLHVGSTAIELDVRLTDLSFRLASDHELFAQPPILSELGVAGLREVRLPRARGRAAQTLPTPSIRLGADSTQTGTITLDLTLPEGAVVSLHKTTLAEQYRLSFSEAAPSFEASLEGPLYVVSNRQAARALDVAIPRPITFYARDPSVDLDLTFRGGPPRAFAHQLPIDSLSLLTFRQTFEPDLPASRTVSAIAQGTLYFEALNGKAYALRPGEALRLRVREGVIRQLSLVEGQIALRFHGQVEALSTGVGRNHRNLMPSWLEYWSTRAWLEMLWTAVVLLFGLVVTVLKFFGD